MIQVKFRYETDRASVSSELRMATIIRLASEPIILICLDGPCHQLVSQLQEQARIGLMADVLQGKTKSNPSRRSSLFKPPTDYFIVLMSSLSLVPSY